MQNAPTFAPERVPPKHKGCRLYLGEEVVNALRTIQPSTPLPNKKVFKGITPGMKRLKSHLLAAGLPYQDERGRFADFQALRFTFVTRLGQSGVPL